MGSVGVIEGILLDPPSPSLACPQFTRRLLRVMWVRCMPSRPFLALQFCLAFMFSPRCTLLVKLVSGSVVQQSFRLALILNCIFHPAFWSWCFTVQHAIAFPLAPRTLVKAIGKWLNAIQCACRRGRYAVIHLRRD